MRPHGKTRLGFFPLPVFEAERLKKCLAFPPEFSALDPCVGDGVAFARLLEGTRARRYGIEIDANRAEQATGLGIDAACEYHGRALSSGVVVAALSQSSL